MRQLRLSNSPTVINPIRRFHQSHLFDLVASCADVAKQLYPHGPFRAHHADRDVQRLQKLLLLPEKSLYHRRGVVVELVDAPDGSQVARITIGRNSQHHRLNNLPKILGLMLKRTPSIYLGVGKLFTHKGAPVEVRVSAQKQAPGRWKIIDKLHKQELFAPQDANPQPSILHDWLQQAWPDRLQDVGEVIAEIERNALALCSLVDLYMANMGSLTFDYLLIATGKTVSGLHRRF